MASDPKNPAPGEPTERQKMMRVLIPAGVLALVVIVVAVLASTMGGGSRAMSDGSDGGTSDPGLKEISAGVQIRDLKEGAGEACTPGATVSIKYTGWLTDGTVFDSSHGSPVEFNLTGLIQGWQVGIPGMKPGGIRKLVVSPEKGYGNQTKGAIPGGSTLIFEVQLVSISAPPRPRRTPPPTDLKKLSDGTLPTADDPDLKPIGPPGLMYRDIKVGDGPEAMPGATVKMDYIGWRRKDGFVFDSTWTTGSLPYEAPLAGLIAGWQKGVPGMKVGGIRKLVIPSELGYGDREIKDKIPPNSTLVFEIELLGVK